MNDMTQAETELRAKLEASEAECASWRTVLNNERESHVWDYTPAMAEARINQLLQQLAASEQRVKTLEEELLK